MDKYTVDLDQVLNDFEYSELTTDQTPKVLHSGGPSYLQNLRNNTTKHSINNVFNSLNEYISSEIAPIEVVIAETQPLVEQCESSDSEDEQAYELAQSTPEVTKEASVEPSDSSIETIENDSEDSAKEEVEEILEDIIGVVVEEKATETEPETESSEVDNSFNSQEVIAKPESPKFQVTIEKSITTIGFDENMDLDEEELHKYLDEFEKEYESQDEEELQTDEGIEKDLSKDNNVQVSISKEETITIEKNVEQESNENLDESKPEKNPLLQVSGEVEIKTLKKDVEDLKTKETVDVKIKQRKDLEEKEIMEVKEIKGVKEPEEVKESLELEGSTVMRESTEVKESTKIKERTKVKRSAEVKETKETIEPKLDELSKGNILVEKVEVKELKQVKQEEVLEEVVRPNNLPLAQNNEDNESKSVINLIGNPGSTPYNNVYVNKELKPPTATTTSTVNATTEEPETLTEVDPGDSASGNVSEECSTSASPTFSDISTETTSSCTPSTDTVNDDDNLNESAIRSPPRVDDVNLPPPESLSQSNDVTVNETAAVEGAAAESARETEENTGSGVVSELERDEARTDEGQGDNATETNDMASWLGKQAPLWIPDANAPCCLHCEMRFTVLKRRHHCRACGLVLCSKCCFQRLRLEYLDDIARVCNRCFDILHGHLFRTPPPQHDSSSGSEQSSPRVTATPAGSAGVPRRSINPNPNNPAEYCSTVPPHQQVGASGGQGAPPPSVMVPVGVLKRKGSGKARTAKSVMFCDGIRPGSDLTSLDGDFGYNVSSVPEPKDSKKRPVVVPEEDPKPSTKSQRNTPPFDQETKSFIPNGAGLPPTVSVAKADVTYSECSNGPNVVEMLKNETLTFCLQLNFLVHLKIINMDCCVNKYVWCFSTEGLINVGQDEIVILMEVMDDEKAVPKDIFIHLNNIYADAVKGNSVKEMGLSLHNASTFLDSKNHAGFVYIRPTFQCLQNIIRPKEPYLIGILIHRWETPWAKLFPLRLILRLGAEYRYYPCPIISTRHRDSVFVEIGHTIINLLADFRNFSYTLPQIRGLTIHMEDKNTTVIIPVNRYDQVMKSMNNSSDHILAFAGNFSDIADSHLVCIQDTQSNENAYSTHAINIHNKPRKVTGASFIVFNGALKSSSGLTAKSSIVEDGLMIQIPSEHMLQVRESLRNMKNHTIQCGCINSTCDETVHIVWGEADVNFNVNVISPIDDQSMSGVPSIRVHNGKDFVCNSGNRLIRWTEVFILQNGEETCRTQDPVDISKVSESIAKATCTALVKYLELLVSNNFYKIGIRTTLHIENVSYLAGSNAMKLPPIYMKSLDNELIPVLHRITSNNFGDNAITLELIFHILNK